jgi:hypothetical protein
MAMALWCRRDAIMRELAETVSEKEKRHMPRIYAFVRIIAGTEAKKTQGEAGVRKRSSQE